MGEQRNDAIAERIYKGEMIFLKLFSTVARNKKQN